jgi:NodT family efflux transporter outer membrane factor (OMF) lipoprotein
MSCLHNARKGRTMTLRLMAALLPISLAGCALHPDLGPQPELSSPASLATTRTFAGPEIAWPSDTWWKSYNDPQLSSLIETALAGSPSLAAAAARVRQADSSLQSAKSSRSIAVQGNGSLQSSYQELDADGLPPQIQDALPDDVQTKASASLSFSRQLDFFGRNRANIAAATSSAEAARAEEAAARLYLSTSVAQAYTDLARLYSDRKAAQDAIRVRTESADLVGQRLRNGLENEGRLYQAKAEISSANVDLASIDGQIARTRNAIAALLGKGPDAGLDIAIPANPSIATGGLPSNLALDLIGRRPDIVAARLYAEAASEKITVAKADFYPNVNLSAIVGIQTLGLDRLGGGDLSYVQAGPAVSLPIFDGGNVEGRYRNARAKYDEAAATYNDTLTTALKEVADAISDRRSLDAQLTQAHAALDMAEQSYRIVRVRYEGGLSSYIDALSAEDQMVELRRSVASLDARAFAIDVALIRALGGGYQEAN